MSENRTPLPALGFFFGVLAFALVAEAIYVEMRRYWRETQPARDAHRLGAGVMFMMLAHDALPDNPEGKAYKSGLLDMLVWPPTVDVSAYMKGKADETERNLRRDEKALERYNGECSAGNSANTILPERHSFAGKIGADANHADGPTGSASRVDGEDAESGEDDGPDA